LTVIIPETVEAMLLFSLENKIPLVSFSEKYVEMGALMSIGVDAFDMGMQAGEMAQRILSGGTVNVHHTDARKAVISINSKVAKKLGISINQRTIGKAELIN
jgi:putative ABC transport system substrate-binding protein